MYASAVVIREARRRAGLTQAELARRIARSQPAIARWESGAVEPGLSTLVEVVRACDLELTLGLAEYDDSYVDQIERMLELTPAQRVARGATSGSALADLRARVEEARHG